MSSSSARIRLWAVVTSAVLALSLVPPAAVADEVGPEPTPTAVSPEPSAEPTPEPTETSTPTPSPTPTATPTPTPAPTPKATVFGYYSLPWTAAVYQAWTDGKITAFSEATWKSRRKALGTPRVTPAPIRYVETSWSDTEYALVTFPQKAGDTAVDRVVVLTPAKKKQAGKHSVKRVAHVPTSTYFRYASSTVDRYVRTPDGSRHKLTATQYAKAGSRALTVVYGGYYRVKWSKDVTFVSRDGSRRELSAKQYAAAGKPRVAIAPTEYVKTPWTGVYALVTWPHEKGDTSVDQVVRLNSAQYKAAGSPTVHKRLRIPGDSFVRLTVGKTIYHRKSGYLTPVTTAQWKSAGSPKISTVKPAKPTYIRGILIANKSLPLPSTYGSGLRAELKTAFAKMQKAARRDGVSLRIISGFRSYASQKSVYASKIRQYGFATAEKRSARPGHSEHQTGLAIDVNSISQAWGRSKEGRWVAKNAHKYGFIVRYPEGKTRVTGYAYEPWHLRHVGVTVATHLYKKKLTLDEYLGVPSKYAD
jgi:LAS superfamily LD-carboxypeptidase LdcB